MPSKHNNPSTRDLLLQICERVARLESQVSMLKWMIGVGLSAIPIIVTLITLFA